MPIQSFPTLFEMVKKKKGKREVTHPKKQTKRNNKSLKPPTPLKKGIKNRIGLLL